MDRKFFKVAVAKDMNVNEEAKDMVKYVYSNLADLLAQAMDFSFEEVTQDSGGILLPNGNWTGAIGMLDRSEVDIAVVPLFITEERRQVIDYNYPFIVSEVTFVTKKPEFVPYLLGIFYVFDEPVWIAFGISMFVTMILKCATSGKKHCFTEIIFDVVGTSLMQPSNIKSRSVVGKLLAVYWLISSTFLSMCYVSVLLSFLSFPVLKEICTIPELAKAVEQGSYKCSTHTGSSIAFLLSTSGNHFMKIIGDNIELNPDGHTNIDKFINSSESNIAYIGTRANVNFLRENYFVSNDNFFLMLVSIAVRKNFCCKSQLEKAMRAITEAGLFQKLLDEKNFLTIHSHMLLKNSEIKHPRELSVYDIGGAMIILMVGYFVSFLVLLFELILSNWH